MAEAKGKRSVSNIRPALSPEAQENQMISLAVDLAKKQLIEGTASSQVITHFLKLGTTKAELEKERMRNENLLIQAKTEAIKAQEDQKVLYENAIKAFQNYNGVGDPDDYSDIH